MCANLVNLNKHEKLITIIRGLIAEQPDFASV